MLKSLHVYFEKDKVCTLECVCALFLCSKNIEMFLEYTKLSNYFFNFKRSLWIKKNHSAILFPKDLTYQNSIFSRMTGTSSQLALNSHQISNLNKEIHEKKKNTYFIILFRMVHRLNLHSLDNFLSKIILN